MINGKTLARLAGVTFFLFIAGALIGPDNDVLWIVDDIVWFSFIACALMLVVLTVTVLAKTARTPGRRSG